MHGTQLVHKDEKPNLFTSPTDDWWRLIRKGLSPAFSANNLRFCCPHCLPTNLVPSRSTGASHSRFTIRGQ